MNNNVLFGIYLYEGKKVFRYRRPNEPDMYLNENDEIVIVKDENQLQTIQVMIGGKLKSPWHH